MLQWASSLIRETLIAYQNGYSGCIEPYDQDLLTRIELGFDQAIKDLQDARFHSLIVAGMFNSEQYDEDYKPEIDILIDSIGQNPVHRAQGSIGDIAKNADRVWLSVQDRVRDIRRRMIQWMPLSELEADIESLNRSCEEFDLAAARIDEAWNVLSEAYESMRVGDFRSALWFDKATNGALSADRLRKAGHRGLIQREKVRYRWTYSVDQVKERWTEYAELIDAAIHKDQESAAKMRK
jgi:hypothetical protein